MAEKAALDELLARLNPQQRKAVKHGNSPLLVVAGAGTGKTATLVHRVAWLIGSGVDPARILLLTFTRRAAAEMIRRADAALRHLQRAEETSGRKATGSTRIWGGTFHHVGNLILRKHAGLLGFKNSYTILDREDSRVLMESAVREEGIDTKSHRFPRGNVLLEVLSYARNTNTEPGPAVEVKCDHFLPLLPQMEKVFRRYEERKLELNYLDFDDLLLKTDQLFRRGYASR